MNYAFANEGMENLAARDPHCLCIQWGGVDNVGQAAFLKNAGGGAYELEPVARLLDFLDEANETRTKQTKRL